MDFDGSIVQRPHRSNAASRARSSPGQYFLWRPSRRRRRHRPKDQASINQDLCAEVAGARHGNVPVLAEHATPPSAKRPSDHPPESLRPGTASRVSGRSLGRPGRASCAAATRRRDGPGRRGRRPGQRAAAPIAARHRAKHRAFERLAGAADRPPLTRLQQHDNQGASSSPRSSRSVASCSAASHSMRLAAQAASRPAASTAVSTGGAAPATPRRRSATWRCGRRHRHAARAGIGTVLGGIVGAAAGSVVESAFVRHLFGHKEPAGGAPADA